MIKNFDEVKQQLRELAEVVNAYKSEAVQLRVIELVFAASRVSDNSEDQSPDSTEKGTRKRVASPRRPRSNAGKRKEAVESGAESGRAKRSAGGRLGPRAAFTRMYAEGFFKGHKRTIGDVVAHAETNLATKIKQSDISGPLARFVRDNKLTRSKNNDNQYEYVQA